MVDKNTVMEKLRCGEEDYPHTLAENFGHALEKIMELWGTPECDQYLADLLQPMGRGSGGRLNREGFPPETWDEIMKLGVLHKRQQEALEKQQKKKKRSARRDLAGLL